MWHVILEDGISFFSIISNVNLEKNVQYLFARNFEISDALNYKKMLL